MCAESIYTASYILRGRRHDQGYAPDGAGCQERGMYPRRNRGCASDVCVRRIVPVAILDIAR